MIVIVFLNYLLSAASKGDSIQNFTPPTKHTIFYGDGHAVRIIINTLFGGFLAWKI